MKNPKNKTCPAVAIVGMSAIFPGSETVGGFWQNILDKEDQIKEVPTSHWLVDDFYDEDPKARDKTYGKTGGFLPDVSFDPMAFGMPPNALEATDTGQLLAMMVAKNVLDDAFKGQFSEADKSKISVILGTTGSTELIIEMAGRMERPKWVKALREEGLDEERVQSVCDRISAQYVEWKESSFPGLLANVVAGRIAHRLDLGGTNFVTDAACASSLAALNIALNELYLGNSDVVITGGVDALNTISMFMCFSKTPALSASGDCRPFSDHADGTILGEGIGMIAIKRLDDAERDGDQIYGVIKGLGSSSDGKGSSVYAPVPEGQAVCMQRAYEAAGYSPDTVELLEAHGTATKAGDAAEFKGLRSVFKADGDHQNYCALGSVKSNIGHTKASAGIAGLMKAVMALNHKTFPPTIKVGQPSPKLDIENSAFYLNTESRPWVRGDNYPRRASVSSFGFGGTNFHVTLEEYLQSKTALGAKRKRTLGSELFLFSVDDAADLSQPIISELISTQSHKNDNSFRFLIAESHSAFNPKSQFRLAIVAEDIEDLDQKLTTAFGLISKNPEASFEFPNGIFYGCGLKPEKLAFLFSGQGSQYLNMGGDVAMKFDAAIDCWDAQAESTLWKEGQKLHQVVFPNPAFNADDEKTQNETLKSTQWAQPAIATVSLSHLALMKSLGLEANAVAGHSLGELTALHAAGAFDEQTLLAISRERGLLMNEAAKKPGAMLAVLATAEQVQNLLTSTNSKVTIANYNAPNQTIVAGSESDVAGFSEQLSAQSLKFTSLPVATAFHSDIVSPSVTPFKAFLKEQRFNAANIPVFGNLNGKPYPKQSASVKKQLGEQIANPVRFVDQIEVLYAEGVRTFVELGPDSVLTGLAKSCLHGRDFTALALDKKGKNGIEQLWNTLGSLAVQGYELDLKALMQSYEHPVDPTTIITPKMLVTIGGANYGKKYPPIEGSSALPKANSEDSKLTEIRAQLEQESEITMKEEIAKQLELQGELHANSAETEPVQVSPVQTAPVQEPVQSDVSASVAYVESSSHQAMNQNFSNDWQSTFREVKEETLKAQLAFQTSMAESHQAFLKTAEIAMMQSMASPSPQTVQPVSVTSPVSHIASNPQSVFSQISSINQNSSVPQSSVIVESTAPMASAAPAENISPEPVPGLAEPIAEVKASVLPEKPQQASSINMNDLMLDIVAEKTGYPSEMLNLGMHLEDDLGIDSIKRVEILAAVMEAVPDIPEVDNSEMSKMSTLQEIVDYMDLQMPPVAATAQVNTQTGSAAPSIDLQGLMLNVVAEKTGYPSEMLNLDMHLENDLGIDSIKRVEILAAVMEAAPEIPELDNSEMAKLSTLKEIVEFMGQQMPTVAAAPQSIQAVSAAPSIDLQGLMLYVVAEKTGYPSEMLNLDMHLENDLGIDSIKRVEILAAVMEAAPEIPELDNSEMAKLSTLKEIVEFMGQQLPQVTAAPQETQTESAASAVNSIDASALQSLMLDVVAEKTGYPSEMLNLDMHLENDLGIDSIKRVEILAGVMEAAPEIPELDSSEMAKLSTLIEIVEYMGQQLPAGANQTSSQSSVYVLPEDSALSQVARFSLRWKEAPALKLQVQNISAAATVLITDEDRGIASALVKKFCEQGYDAHLVNSLDDRLLDQTKILIFTGGLRKMSSVKNASDVNKEGFEWVRRVAERIEKNSGTLITVQDTGGRFMSDPADLKDCDVDMVSPYLAGLSGLCKTAALEWPNAYVKAIDIECGDRSKTDLADSLFNEIVEGGFEKEVGLLKNGTRGTLVSMSSSVSMPSHNTLTDGAVIVASGGARGVTAACLIELSKAVKPKIALLGRTALVAESPKLSDICGEPELKKHLLAECQARAETVSPAILGQRVKTILANRDVRQNIKRMEGAGATVEYFVCDIRNQESVCAALEQVRQLWGTIDGLVHGAGVIADKLIAEKTDDQFNAVFGTKIEGINALLSATENDALSMICLFSSVAGRSGNRGQSDYAMANEALNKVAASEYARRNTDDKSCQVKSINWGPWDSGMVSPALKKQFAAMGVPMIPLKEGAEIFVAEVLGGSSEQVEIVVGAKPDGSLLSAADRPAKSLLFNISEKDFEFLAGHNIADVPVVPCMLVADWVTRACHSNWPNLKVTELKDFRCLKGIKLSDFYQQGNQIELVMQEVSLAGPDAEITVAVSLLSELGPHYSAEVSLSEEKTKPTEALVHLPNLSPIGIDNIYDGEVLFHKNEFQVIKNIIGSSEQGIEGTLSVKSDLLLDQSLSSTLLLDGGLQVALLWVWQKMGGGSIPLSIEAMKLYSSDFSGEINCQVKVQSSSKQKTTVDVVYYNDKGLKLAEIVGLDLLVHFEKAFSDQEGVDQKSVDQAKASSEAMDAL